MIKAIIDSKVADLEIHTESNMFDTSRDGGFEREESCFSGEGTLLLKDLNETMAVASMMQKLCFW